MVVEVQTLAENIEIELPQAQIRDYYYKKYKSYQIRDLFPLYKEHAVYLLRAIKSGGLHKHDNFLTNLESYYRSSRCHEIAINSYASFSLDTHQNKRGKERAYTNHESAKCIGRDLRVKLIWHLIIDELKLDPNLSNYKKYKGLNKANHDYDIECPFCGHLVYKTERVSYGRHRDGTENYYHQMDRDSFDPCEHYIAEYDGDELYINFSNLIGDLREIYDKWEFEKIFEIYESDLKIDSACNENNDEDKLYFVSDRERFKQDIIDLLNRCIIRCPYCNKIIYYFSFYNEGFYTNLRCEHSILAKYVNIKYEIKHSWGYIRSRTKIHEFKHYIDFTNQKYLSFRDIKNHILKNHEYKKIKTKKIKADYYKESKYKAYGIFIKNRKKYGLFLRSIRYIDQWL